MDEDGNIVNNGGNTPPGLNRREKGDKPDNPNKPEKPGNPGTEDSSDKKANKAQKGTHIYTYDELNQLVSRKQGNESYSYSYDKRGNRIAETGKKETREYIYDETNHLVEGTNWKGDVSSYTYNGVDVRINNTQTSHSGSVYSRDYVIDYTSLERDDLMIYAEGDGQLDYVQREVYAGSERLEQFTDRTSGGYERILYVHEDLMGNTRYYTKENGNSFAELTYDAWGMPESPNKLLNNDHGNYVYATYTGHIFDTTLDIYFAEARFYDANTRTWLAMDPIKDGDNWYQYCYSNPLKYWDPTGLSGFTKYACDFFNNVKGQFDQAVNSVKSWAYSVDWGRFGIGLAKGLGAVALLVGGIAVIGATGGAALPVVVGSLSSTAILWATQILGAATIAFGLSDLMEAAQDIANSLVSPETGSINPLRDQIFGMLGINPEDYYIIEALVGSAATAGASVVNAFALSGQAISLQTYISNKVNASSSFTWTLRGETVTLNNVSIKNVSYIKRNAAELQSLRTEFNTSTRKAFLQDLGKNSEYLKNAGFSETDILKIQNGRVPNGWQVHHKLPLDAGGSNTFDNLVLIQNEPYQKVLTNYQNSIAGQMKAGEVQTVQWPMPNGNIYPENH